MYLRGKDTLWLNLTKGHPPFLAVCLFLLILFIFGVYLWNTPPPQDLSIKVLGPPFAIGSAVVVLGMFFLYYFAYRFYEDSFYLFVSLGWLANVIHVTFETYFISSWDDLNRSLTIAVLSAFLMVPFYVAGLLDKNDGAFRRRHWHRITLGWCMLFLVATVLTRYYDPVLREIGEAERFKLITLPSIIFSSFTLAAVGLSLKSRLHDATHGRLKNFYPATFFAYAALQPCYLLKVDKDWQAFLFWMFVFALGIKVVNSLMTLLAMYYYYSDVQKLQAATQTRFEMERAKLEVVQAKLSERSAMEELGKLTASIQHDIQNPLVVIDSELGKLKDRLQSYPEVLTRLRRIDEMTDKISEATTVVPLLRGSDNYFQKLMQKVALEDLINSILKVVKREMNTTNVFFRINKKSESKSSPKTESKHFIRGYTPLLERAIINILKNSLEAISEAKRASGIIDIEIAEDPSSDATIRLDITDNGRGIAAEDLPKVTSLFTTRGDRKANSGIGLFISNRIMEVHKGTLKLESENGVGTKVTFLLPKWRDDRHIT